MSSIHASRPSLSSACTHCTAPSCRRPSPFIGREFANLFVEDGKVSGHNGDPATNPPLYEMQGVDVIQQGMKGLEKYEVTYHLVANQLLWPESADEVRGETYCTAHHLETRDDGVRTDHTMFIRYQDRFVRTPAGWRFSERKLAVDFDRQAPLAN